MSKTLVITALVAAILTIGLVATAVSSVFADSNQIKQSNKANTHIKGDGNTVVTDQDNAGVVNSGID
jgi:hypothetical protein